MNLPLKSSPKKSLTGVLLGSDAGLRGSEALNLTLKDIDFNQNLLIIRDQKNGTKFERQPMTLRLAAQLKKHIREYQEGIARKRGALFPTSWKHYQHLSPYYLRKVIDKIRKEADL